MLQETDQSLINTSLQRGVRAELRIWNRLSGFDAAGETAQAVKIAALISFTPLKRGVNDRGKGSARSLYGNDSTHRSGISNHRASHIFIVRETKSAASCWTKCPAPGIVTSVKSFSNQFQVPFNPSASSAASPNP